MDISNLLADFKLRSRDMNRRNPHAISVYIEPLNYNNVGNTAFQVLVKCLKARKLGELERSGDFYDSTLYGNYVRTYTDDTGHDHVELPNSRVYSVGRNPQLKDLVLMSLLEPNHFGEIYVDRIVALLKGLGVKRYQVVGAMGSYVPHTRPIIVNGRSSDPELMEELKRLGVRERPNNRYRSSASVFNMIAPRLQHEGITTVSLVASLPGYFGIDGDYMGVHSVLRVLSQLEKFDIPEELETAGREQYAQISEIMSEDPKMLRMVEELEHGYDENQDTQRHNEPVGLSPETLSFLGGIGNRI